MIPACSDDVAIASPPPSDLAIQLCVAKCDNLNVRGDSLRCSIEMFMISSSFIRVSLDAPTPISFYSFR